MDYFELFGIAPRFSIDLKALEKRYFDLQRELHPDRMVVAERATALQKSADINQGYHTLKSPLKRAQHLLALQGIRVNTDNDTVKPAMALLNEIMEWRERLAEGVSDALLMNIETRERETFDALQAAFDAKEYDRAAHLTLQLNYLSKLLNDARLQESA